MKLKVIANPTAGKGSARLLIPKVEQRLRSYGLNFDLTCTERSWHAYDLARAASAGGYDVVVAAGGDGTFNEVLNGLMQAREDGSAMPSLGIICIGRGNDFAYGAGIPIDWEKNCEMLAGAARRPIDIGRVTSDCMPEARYFGNGMGIGFDARINVQANKIRLGGFIGYTVAALETILMHFNSPRVQISCDSRTITQPSIMIEIMNGQRMGGGFYSAPNASNDDGMLDLCIARQVSRPTILRIIPLFMRGTQGSHPAIRFERSRHIEITALEGEELPMQIDGETVCTARRSVIVDVLPGAVEIVQLSGK